MKERTAKSIDDVMRIVAEARIEWRLSPDQEIWFRGEDSKHRKSTLQPKLYRDLPPATQFASMRLLKDEFNSHEEFERCGAQLYDHEDVDHWDWYFLMQHHGAPTRLLDWSDGALMGAHFAVSGDLKASKGGTIYCLDCYQLLDVVDNLPEIAAHKKAWRAYRKERRRKGSWWPSQWDKAYLPGKHSLKSKPITVSGKKPRPSRPALPSPPLVLEFPHITRRVAAQRSRFMLYGRDKNWLIRWAKEKSSNIWRINIPKSNLIDIRVQLRDSGVTESVIFPDLDGLGRELSQQWSTVKLLRRTLQR